MPACNRLAPNAIVQIVSVQMPRVKLKAAFFISDFLCGLVPCASKSPRTLASLKTPAKHKENKGPGTNGTGEQLDQSKKTRGQKSHQITPRTHQNTSDDSRTHQEHVQHLQGTTEANKSQHCNTKSSTNPKGTPPEPEPPED